jgi:hypothetical protein
VLFRWARLPTKSGRWCRWLGHGVEGHWGSGSGLRAHGALLNFLKIEVIVHLLERREGHRVGEDCAKMLVLLVEAVEYVEDEDTIGDVSAKIVEGGAKPLHLLTIIVHVEVALNGWLYCCGRVYIYRGSWTP